MLARLVARIMAETKSVFLESITLPALRFDRFEFFEFNRPLAWMLCITALLCFARAADSAEFTTTRALFLSGQYEEAEKQAATEAKKGSSSELWPSLLIECQMTQGKYDDALKTYERAIKRFPTSLALRMLGVDILRHNNLIDRSVKEHDLIMQLLQSAPSRFSSRENLIAAGRYFESVGEDARQILKLFYDQVRDADPDYLDAYIATAELALNKGDFAVAAQTLQAAEKFDATDPQTAYLLARAFEPSDSQQANDALQRSLDLNPHYIPSLLMVVENAIDGEQYDKAEETIDRIIKINPKYPLAIASQAVIAHVRGDYKAEKKFRDKALETWSQNPEVDHWIGRKLSQKYRFKEGAEYQRSALQLAPDHVGASFQLAQDLLRLGDEDDGWRWAHSVADEDEYNVVAHNLATLHDVVSKFRTIEADDIHIRMDPREAAIYGDDVVELLSEARKVLCAKYDVKPNAPIIVEIFPEQKDFAIRTFGLPGGAGFLGVCFGRVITANSPASQGSTPSNWRSVLWHEFCHVVTLEKTKNRMPRWLSEGISVYEERQRDPSWGESMTPQYREMLLADDLTPVSNLSAAFLNPPTPVHLQFAYYESSLVIEYLMEKHGIDSLKKILSDLGDGLPINDALTRNVGSLDKLDVQFNQYARNHAESFGSKAKWGKDGMPEKPSQADLVQWVKDNPDHYWGRRSLAERLIRAKEYDSAKEHLEHLVELETTSSDDGILEMLAAVYRNGDDEKKEEQTLLKIISMTGDALPALKRLTQIAKERGDWKAVRDYSQKSLAIHPLLVANQQEMATAAQQLGRHDEAVRSLRALTQMDPVDPAGLNFQLAKSLFELGSYTEAKHHVLAALTEAPRYRDAHRLLLELEEKIQANESEPEAATRVNPKKPTKSKTKKAKASSTDVSEANPESKP
jgi:tetratricopeptide (TPR) repeat protein